MKVLMFGWEFPPHISGGLGTACHGITKALLREKVKILFVVPRAFGDEDISVINASEVSIASEKLNVGNETVKTIVEEDGTTTFYVPSTLSGYYSAKLFQEEHNVRHWNYQLSSSAPHTEKSGRFARYRFTGGYGSTLMDEVQRYAEVAVEISRKNEFDVIHVHDWMTYPAGIAVKEATGKPLIVHVHSTEYDRAGECIDPSVFALELRGMLKADLIVTVSEWTKEMISARYNISKEKIAVVHNGIDPAKTDALATLPIVGTHIVTFLGRVTHQKGPQFFLEAARKVIKEFPDAHFILAGSGDLLPQMIEQVAEWRLSSHFHFTGFLSRDWVNAVWAMSHVYVMPSVSEPFGISPLEAIQAGVPVIISNQSGVAEVMPHAIKVDFWDTEALADAICNVLSHKSLSNTLKKKGRKEIKHLTWRKTAKKINLLYHELAP